MSRYSPVIALLLVGASMLATGCRGGANDPGDVEASPTSAEGHIVIEGTVADVARMASVVLVEDGEGRMWSVSTAQPYAMVMAVEGGSVPSLLGGLPVRVSGIRVGADSIRPDTVFVLDLPEILLEQPRSGAALLSPVIPIQGHSYRGRPARYRLMHGSEALLEGTLRAEAYGVRRYGAFRDVLILEEYDLQEPLQLLVWLDGEDPDGAVSHTIRFALERTLRLFYPNSEADPARLRCDNVYPVSVPAPVLSPPADVVQRLIDVPDAANPNRGFFSEISTFGQVRSVQFESGLARVDLAPPAGGAVLDSCAVISVRAQVLSTLSEAFGIDSVRVTVGGEELVAAP